MNRLKRVNHTDKNFIYVGSDYYRDNNKTNVTKTKKHNKMYNVEFIKIYIAVIVMDLFKIWQLSITGTGSTFMYKEANCKDIRIPILVFINLNILEWSKCIFMKSLFYFKEPNTSQQSIQFTNFMICYQRYQERRFHKQLCFQWQQKRFTK